MKLKTLSLLAVFLLLAACTQAADTTTTTGDDVTETTADPAAPTTTAGPTTETTADPGPVAGGPWPKSRHEDQCSAGSTRPFPGLDFSTRTARVPDSTSITAGQ